MENVHLQYRVCVALAYSGQHVLSEGVRASTSSGLALWTGDYRALIDCG